MSGARLTILHALAPAPFGGLERVVQDLAEGHAARGHRVVVAASVTDPSHPYLESMRGRGVDVRPIVTPASAYLRERRAIADLTRALVPHVVHTHGYRSDVIASAVARGSGVPVVSTVHGFTGGGLKNRFYEWVQVRSFRRHDAVVAVSRRLAEDLAERGAPARLLCVIRNAWRPREMMSRTEARAALGASPDRFLVGWVGRLSREKAPDVLLDAVARVPDLPIEACIIGDGPERKTLEDRSIGGGLAQRVRFLGPVRDAGRLMRGFDVFVLSSRTEGTPIVLFEAMAAGVPIIATSVGGVPDVVSPGEALLVPPDAPAAIAEALVEVLRNPAAAHARSEAAARRLEEAFSSESWLDQYERLYRAVGSLNRSVVLPGAFRR